MTEKLIRTDKDYIAYLKLNDNPANSLSSEMMGAIQAELTEIDTNPSIRVVVFDSASEKIFCSGHSLTDVWVQMRAIRVSDTVHRRKDENRKKCMNIHIARERRRDYDERNTSGANIFLSQRTVFVHFSTCSSARA